MLCLFVVWLLINLLASLNGVLLIDLLSIIIKKNLKIPKEEYESELMWQDNSRIVLAGKYYVIFY
jgi:hypothetical protein